MIGFLNVNKPTGFSSAQVVARVKRILPKGTKVGHLGTLDPMASGVLPIAVGRATRLFDLMQNKKKEYFATFKFGQTTDTLDATGQKTEECKKIPTKQEILDVLPHFIGEINQIPPVYSAKNVNGTRSYKLARNGEQVELEPCKVKIFSFELIEQIDGTSFKFKIECGSGTYIRSLCRDLAHSLDTVAVMTELVRTKSGPFCLESAQDCDKIDLYKIISVGDALKFDKLTLTDAELKILLDGKKLQLDCKDGMFLAFNNNVLQGVFTIKNKAVNSKIWLR